MAALPEGEGVLTPGAQGAYRLILFVIGWFVAGVATTIAAYTLIGQPAHAASSASVERQLASIVYDIGEIKKDMAAVKCRVNLSNVCPPDK